MTGNTLSAASISTPGRRLVAHAALMLFAFSPAILQLILLLPLRVPVPYQDGWAFVNQYRNWLSGHYGWREFFMPHNVHPSVPGKLVYFAVLHFGKGNLGVLPLISWLQSLVISVSVCLLSRAIWRGRPALGATLIFFANLSIFTAAAGMAWIWEFVFQNFIPGTCLAVGLLTLGGKPLSCWRWVVAVLASLTAAFAFGTGFAVGFLLLPAVLMAMSQESGRRKIMVTAIWVTGCVAAGWLALNAAGPGERQDVAVSGLVERPVSSLHYILAMMGHTLGRGTAIEPSTLCAVWGVLLSVAFLWCVGRIWLSKDTTFWRQCWPWTAFCLWALVNAGAICVGRFRANVETGLTSYYGIFMLFMPLGTTMLWTAVRCRAEEGRPALVLRILTLPAATMLLIAHGLSWTAGVNAMELFSRKMLSRQASFGFAKALPVRPEVFWHLEFSPRAAGLAIFLADKGLLSGVSMIPDAAISSFQRAKDNDKRGDWKLVTTDGKDAEMRGTCSLPKVPAGTPELVLVTAESPGQPEQVVALLPPEPPDDFFERVSRRRKYAEHYFGWMWPVDSSVLPPGDPVTLRAYAYEAGRRRIRLIPGEAVLPLRQH